MEICTVGGYSEVGKNMTVVKYQNEAIILDMGVQVDKYISAKDEDDDGNLSERELLNSEAIPKTQYIKHWKKYVRAIVPTHAHLDHIGAIPFLAHKFHCPIIGTKFTTAVLNAILADKKISLPNKIITLGQNDTYQVSENIAIEFINATHSTPDTVMIAVHTPEGILLYSNDFKFDNYPVIGKKPNYKRLKELGKKGIKVLIVDSLYSNNARKTPSESIARQMLRDVMISVPGSKEKAIIVTTFSSHIARLKSINDFGKKMGRKVVFLGRSLHKYCTAASDCGIIDFPDVEIIGYRKRIKKKLREIQKIGKEKYLIVVTGHQGESNAVLSRLAKDEFKFRLEPEDHVIFSCTTIPNPVNIANREILESILQDRHVRIFKDIHMSGHASREDHRDFIHMVNPEHIIPSHGDITKTSGMLSLAKELGYKPGKTVLMMQDGQIMEL